MLTRTYRYAAGLAIALSAGLAHADTTLDIMVLYDADTAQRFNNQPETMIHNWIEQANQMYRNSGVQTQLRLVHTARSDAAGSSMSEVLRNITNDAAIRDLRNQYGADFVTQIHRTGNCGVAWLANGQSGQFNRGAADWAYSVVGSRCGALVLAHELGHNMGLAHSRAQGDTTGGVFHHGLGHGVYNSFATIMAYPQTFNAPHMPLFSNPDLSCSGMPCGVPIGEPEAAHAVAAINAVRSQLAVFRPTVVGSNGGSEPTPPPPSCPSGSTTFSGTLAAGATQYQPDGSYYRTGTTQTHSVTLQGPDTSNFDLHLLRWSGWSWSTVATSNTAGSSESLSYRGTAGYYTIAVRAVSGAGDYTLCRSLQ